MHMPTPLHFLASILIMLARHVTFSSCTKTYDGHLLYQSAIHYAEVTQNKLLARYGAEAWIKHEERFEKRMLENDKYSENWPLCLLRDVLWWFASEPS